MNIIIKLFYFFLLLLQISNSQSNTIEVKGKVKQIIQYEGTFSETRYFVLKQKLGRVILFNEKNFSTGFEKYIDRYVIIKGQEITGFIGWKKEKKKGYKVISIDIIK